MLKTSKALLSDIRAELNHLYTEPPSEHADGQDAGWFCREHALHVAALAEMYGEKAELCLGNFVLVIPNDLVLAMVETGEDHSWCRVNGIVPIDASLTITHFGASVPDVQLVSADCPEALGAFQLRYLQGASFQELQMVQYSEAPLICYNETRSFQPKIGDLLQDPFSFLLAPTHGLPNLQDIHGPDVFFAITSHLHKLVSGSVGSVRSLPPRQAVGEIVRREKYPRVYMHAHLRN